MILNEFRGTFAAVPPEVSAIRLVASVALGGTIGLEREWRAKPAGLRTHMLVSMASCLFIIVAQQLASLPFAGSESVSVDPTRLIQAVTAGVAFLAAGTIFTSGKEVRNLTTGASMWLAGAIGVACGAGQMPLALMAAVITLIVLVVFGYIEAQAGDES